MHAIAFTTTDSVVSKLQSPRLCIKGTIHWQPSKKHVWLRVLGILQVMQGADNVKTGSKARAKQGSPQKREEIDIMLTATQLVFAHQEVLQHY